MYSTKYCLLSEFIDTHTMDLEIFLSMAINISKALYTVHHQGQIVENLSPEIILIHNDNIIQFSQNEVPNPESENIYYMAPEQFSDASTKIDKRRDIYVLGIIFYKMLLGKLPYSANDIFAFSHNIFTQKVPFLSDEETNIPEVLSRIIEKMMAIDTAERYNDILSVRVDLSKIEHMLGRNEEVHNFPLDTLNSIRELYTTSSMYGREKEENTLQYCIDAKLDSANSIIVVYGKAGIGKSSLVHKTIEKNKNNFSHICKFKLDLHKGNRPYQLLYSALSDMVREILTKDDETLHYYQSKLQTILGDDIAALVTVIPEIRMLLGGDIPEYSADSHVNLDNVLLRFMALFIEEVKPLCIYVDDMQWADEVTLQWIKNVLMKLENIVLFMTYREGHDIENSQSSEGAPENFFTALLADSAGYTQNIESITLQELTADDIESLITTNIDLQYAQEVANIIYKRTKGNPFFVKQYLKQLHTEGIIYFDLEALAWHCDLEKINMIQISDNVLDFLEKNIDLLPSNVRHLLAIASCIGNTFSGALLKSVFDNNEVFDETLQLALSSGWIVSDINYKKERTYHFLHDQMQETLAHLMLPKLAIKMHYKIGCYLEHQREKHNTMDLLRCINHLNIASKYVRDNAFLADLNIEASSYAKQSADFKNALVYIEKAMALFFDYASEEKQFIMLRARAECEHLCNQSDTAIQYYEKALYLAHTQVEKAEIYELLIKLYSDISKFSQAYEVGKIALQSYGIDIPKKFVPPLFIADFLRLKFKLRHYSTQDLLALPVSQDDDFKMTIRLLANTLQAAYQIRPELSVANALIMVRLCLENGLTKESVIGFTVFGVIFQGAILGNHTLGFDYSQFSFEMLKKFDNTVQHAEVEFVCGYFGTSWRVPALETEENWHRAYKNGLNIGDWFHTGCAAAGIVQSMFMRGVAFEDILKQISYFEKVLWSIGAKEQYGAMMSVKQTLLNLCGETESHYSYDSEGFDEKKYVKSLDSYESKHFAHYYFINKMTALYMHEAYAEANAIRIEAKKFVKYSKGMLHDTEYMFYEALILAQLFEDASFTMKLQYKRKIERIKHKFIKWAKGCSENFLVRAHILQAEIFRLEHKHSEAFLAYDKALDIAHIYGQKLLLAIANRLSAQLYDTLGQKKAARVYRQETVKNLHALGMKSVEDLDNINSIHFDVHTLIQASEVIAKEYEFSSLLKTLMHIIIESVGAQHAFLLLEKNGDFTIQASSNERTGETHVLQDIPFESSDSIVHTIVNYVLRSKESIVIPDLSESHIFASEALSTRVVKSVLCAPLMLQGELKGIIYLENNLRTGMFTDNKVQLLQHLSGQIIISIENTIVYNNLEAKVKQRTLDLEATKDELKVLASTDPLTTLYNRRYFSEISKNVFALLKREKSTLSLMMLDIDNFKSVNDTYGHQAGDNVIVAIANKLLEYTRKSDIVCRFGGEEFIILLPHTDEKGTVLIAENIRKSVESETLHIGENQDPLHVTVSIGISRIDFERDKDIEVAIRNADTALYEVKNSGKNNTLFHAKYEE